MNTELKGDFSSLLEDGTRDSMLKLLSQQAELLFNIVHPLSLSADEGRAAQFSILPLAGVETVFSICDLVQKGRWGDCLMLARSVLEWCVNYLFLIYCDDEHARAFTQYSKQKQFRALDRNVEIAGIKVGLSLSPLPSQEDIKGMKEALEAFTSKRGRPKTRWTTLHLHERIDTVKDRSDLSVISLVTLAFLCYEDASEILHGTLYGSLVGKNIHMHLPRENEQSAMEANMNILLLALLLANSLNLAVMAIRDRADLESLELLDLANFSEAKSNGIAETLNECIQAMQKKSPGA